VAASPKLTIDLVAHTPADRRPVDDPSVTPRKLRSKITNGSVLVPGVDQRSPWVRRCKDVIASHLSDLGGLDNTSAAERSIIRRASCLTVELERLEGRFAAANEASDSDLDLYQRTAGNLRRLLEAVGLQRRSKEVGGLTLADLMRLDLEDSDGKPPVRPPRHPAPKPSVRLLRAPIPLLRGMWHERGPLLRAVGRAFGLGCA
jgi:hypothetical protein